MPQTPTPRPQSPPPASPVPAAPAVPGAAIQGVPATPEELTALFHHRGELQSQLERMGQRRAVLEHQRSTSSAGARRELESLIADIDARSNQLDREILRADEAIAVATARGVGLAEATQTPRPPPPPQATTSADPGVIRAVRDAASDAVGESLLGAGFAVLGAWVLWRGFRRFIWKRKPKPPLDQARLEQLQQSVDVIALEVERISEAQRFLSKALNEKLQLGAGPAEPIAVREKDAASVSR